MIDVAMGAVSLYFLTYLLITYLEEERQDPPASSLPTVSVLIPAYNESKTIRKTVESAKALDYPGLEIIVMDDGSTDGTGEIAEHCGVTVIRQKNGGKASALNNGIRKARGELIATLDADSFVAPDALRHMVGYFDNPRVMAVTPTMKVAKGYGALVRLQSAEYMLSNLVGKILCMLDGATVTPGPFSVYRASVFGAVGAFDGSTLTEDNEMALRIQSHDFLIRSSRTAFVYTKVPRTLGALLRQRKRWYIGYLENIRHHSGLLRPKYGELGCFILPVSILLLLMMFLKMALDASSALGAISGGAALSGDGALFQPLWALTLSSSLIGIVLFYLSMSESRESPSISAYIHLTLMMALSPLLYSYAFIMRAYEIITRRSAKW
jgi:cellulose synthase/poly-beta-1,6-N-acetylglucosamine synthase-like glycosyltransferase